MTLELRLDDDALTAIADAVAARLGGQPGAPEAWVDVQRAAEHLACKPQRIYNLVHQRAIPHRKDGSRLLFQLSALDRWLDDSA